MITYIIFTALVAAATYFIGYGIGFDAGKLLVERAPSTGSTPRVKVRVSQTRKVPVTPTAPAVARARKGRKSAAKKTAAKTSRKAKRGPGRPRKNK